MRGFFCSGLPLSLIGINHRWIACQDSFTFSVQVIELAAVNSPAEDGQDGQDQAG